MNQRIYAIGDIHGELDMLKDAVSRIERDSGADARVVFLGDYIDRGPQSRAVIDYLIEARAAGRNYHYLLGNHDRMFAMFMEDTPRTDPRLSRDFHWLHRRLGGVATLASYGVDVADGEPLSNIHQRARAAVPDEHVQFLHSLTYSLQLEELLFVHAGIRPGIPFEQQNKNDLIWIRQEFLNDTRQHPWLVVHGHTPVAEARHYGNRVNLDTGAGYGSQLTTAVFEGSKCWLLSNAGRVALIPQPH